MGPFAAFREAIRRVNAAPVVVLGMFAATLAVALPLSYVMRSTIEAHLGSSLAADTAAAGVNYDWWQEFTAQASGLATTFIPSIAGFGAVLENLSNLLDNAKLTPAITAVTAIWLLVWSFLSGGVIDRFARARPTRSHGFFGACGMHVWRLLRLGLAALAVYAFLFGYVHAWIFVDGYGRWTRDFTAERSAFAVRIACYLLFGTVLILCNLAFDYARVRIVVEDRRSALGALVAGARFVWRNPGSVLGLYGLNAVAFLLAVALYGLAAPGAPRSGWAMWLVLALGEAYILLRHYLKLLFYASETVFFQGALAHAAYTAAPPILWPDSPAAETIANADRATTAGVPASER
jgi:hypothetical protein